MFAASSAAKEMARTNLMLAMTSACVRPAMAVPATAATKSPGCTRPDASAGPTILRRPDFPMSQPRSDTIARNRGAMWGIARSSHPPGSRFSRSTQLPYSHDTWAHARYVSRPEDLAARCGDAEQQGESRLTSPLTPNSVFCLRPSPSEPDPNTIAAVAGRLMAFAGASPPVAASAASSSASAWRIFSANASMGCRAGPRAVGVPVRCSTGILPSQAMGCRVAARARGEINGRTGPLPHSTQRMDQLSDLKLATGGAQRSWTGSWHFGCEQHGILAAYIMLRCSSRGACRAATGAEASSPLRGSRAARVVSRAAIAAHPMAFWSAVLHAQKFQFLY